MPSDATLSMQKQIIANQKKILANQERIERNQSKLDKIVSNQAKLDRILANQKAILPNCDNYFDRRACARRRRISSVVHRKPASTNGTR